MPTDLVARINLDQLYLPFVTRMLDMLAACRARGADYYAISGYRSPQEQMQLYFQGRTNKDGPIVTNARAFESAHNFGLAVDFVRDGHLDRRGLQPDYRPESYVILGEEAARVGLEWGGRWRFVDLPHVQWPGWVRTAELARLKPHFEAGGLTQVFNFLEAEEKP